jgi:divalent metal cation (Fe/Co/Zn/Cd) transporter
MTRDRQIIGVSFAILLANLAVAAAKLVYGVKLGSMAIKADGFHSLLDSVSNVVIIVALSVASKPADTNHPYGHRKFELLASLFIPSRQCKRRCSRFPAWRRSSACVRDVMRGRSRSTR